MQIELTVDQLRILLYALEELQGEVAADLNGWTIGPNKQTDIETLASTVELYCNTEELRIAIDQRISHD